MRNLRTGVCGSGLIAGLSALLMILCVAVAGQSGSLGKAAGRQIEFIRMFQSAADVMVARTGCQHLRDIFDPTGVAHDLSGERPAVCDQVLDVVAGKADAEGPGYRKPILVTRIAVDSHRRVLMTDRATRSIHVLDFDKRESRVIDGAKGNRLLSPFAIAVDASDRVYVTDVKLGMIAVYSAEGKFKRYLGDFKGEGLFQTPYAIAIDRGSGRIYVSDTPRHLVLILNQGGKQTGSIGKRGGGSGAGEFRNPTEIAVQGQELFVFDKGNGRIEVFDLDGHFKREIKSNLIGSDVVGMAVDADGFVYLLFDFSQLEVLNQRGELVSRFGTFGDKPGEFKSAQGIYIDPWDRMYVNDSGNHRVQIFRIGDEAREVRAAAQ